MLGFSSYSEAPYSTAVLTVGALAYLATTTAQFSVGTLAYFNDVAPTLSSTSASFSINAFGDIDAQATTTLVNALASFSLADLADADAQANTSASAVTASFAISDISEVDGQANITLPEIASSFTASGLDFDADANITISNVVSSFDIDDFTSVTGQANITPSAVTALFDLDIDVSSEANISIEDSVTAEFSIDDFSAVRGAGSGSLTTTAAFLSIYLTDFAEETGDARAFMPVAASSISAVDFGDVTAKANTDITDSFLATFNTPSLSDVSGAANNILSSLEVTLPDVDLEAIRGEASLTLEDLILNHSISSEAPTAVQFNYGQFADSYDTGRVVYVLAYGGSDVVHIQAENRLVTVNQHTYDRTVYIQSENRTVYIDTDTQDRTVYIAA